MNAEKLPTGSTKGRARYLIVGISFLLVFAGAIFFASPQRDAPDSFDATKEGFVDNFADFKKAGLTEKEVKELTDKLLELAGDTINGTGTKILLTAMNNQAENTISILRRKAAIEKLINFVADVYSIASSDAPLDSMVTYKALVKGVELATKLDGEMLGLSVTAVPMLKAYSHAIKNGDSHIEAIDAATKAKNSAIELGWESMDHDEVLVVIEMEEMEEIEDDEPDDRELPPLD